MATREERLQQMAKQIALKEDKAKKKKLAAARPMVNTEQAVVEESVEERGETGTPLEEVAKERMDGDRPTVGLGSYSDRPPSYDARAEVQLNLVNRIAEPTDEKLGEMGRIPSGMIMATVRMEYKWLRLQMGYSGRDALRIALFRQFRGRDGLLIKDLQKLKEVEVDKAAAMGQRIMP